MFIDLYHKYEYNFLIWSYLFKEKVNDSALIYTLWISPKNTSCH